ncbi:MAG: phosphate signaling complex protein PhoU, partial [Neomegalonema sp.]
MAPHIVSAFESDLQELRARLSEMGGLAEEQLSESLDAVRRRDLPLARRVITKDLELDQREIALEELAVRTLALRQPLAQDLRETIAALKIASTLERIGDLSKSIAKRESPMSETDLAAIGGERLNNSILGMGQLAQTQLSDVLDAYGARDTAAAVNVWRRDVEIDELYNSLFRELIDLMTR